MDFLTNAWDTFLGLIKSFQVTDALDIILVSFILYNAIKLVRETRAEQLIKGLLILCVVWAAAFYLQLYMVSNILSYIFQFGVIAIIVLFQPEIRRALEQLGRKNILSSFINFGGNAAENEQGAKTIEKTKAEIIKACLEMSKARTGALIVIEQDVQLSEYERTGIFLDSLVSSQLLINIFEHNTPLHDGAVFVRNNRIVAATCYLPLSDNMLLSKELGTRHRAGVGISEVSDSITLIVSEETGMISVAHDGMLFRGLSQDELREQLSTLMKNQDAPKRSRWRRIIKNEKKANE